MSQTNVIKDPLGNYTIQNFSCTRVNGVCAGPPKLQVLKTSIKSIAKVTRRHRKIHKYIAISLFVLMLIIGGTGLLLAWKKEFNLLPPTEKDNSLNPLLSIGDIQKKASLYIFKRTNLDSTVDRIDIRPEQAVAKVRFVNHYSEVQVGIRSGDILSVNTRTSDLIEQIHDGSIVDFFIKSKNENVKRVYVTVTCLGLIILSITGFYLWYSPRRIKQRKRKFKE